MKNPLDYAYNKCFLFIFLLTLSVHAWGINAGAAKCAIRLTDVVSVWQATDSNGNQIIQGSIGTFGSDPSTWTYTDLSATISPAQNATPTLFSNVAGDIVVLWQYSDTNADYHVAAAVLPASSTTWSATTISSSSRVAGYFDQTASIDATGNVLAMWTAYDPVQNITQVRGVTATIGTTTTWSSPFMISQ